MEVGLLDAIAVAEEASTDEAVGATIISIIPVKVQEIESSANVHNSSIKPLSKYVGLNSEYKVSGLLLIMTLYLYLKPMNYNI